MDFSWIITFLIWVIVGSIGFAIVKYLIMPAVAAALQPYVWAVLGIILLIALVIFASGYLGEPRVPRLS
jgi:hypothetical protein